MTKGQGTGKIYLLLRDFLVSRFFFIYCTITGTRKMVYFTKGFVM